MEIDSIIALLAIVLCFFLLSVVLVNAQTLGFLSIGIEQ